MTQVLSGDVMMTKGGSSFAYYVSDSGSGRFSRKYAVGSFLVLKFETLDNVECKHEFAHVLTSSGIGWIAYPRNDMWIKL